MISGGIVPERINIGNNVSLGTGILRSASTANSTKSTQISVIQCHAGWSIVLSIPCMIMAVASLVPHLVCYFTRQVPDLILNISCLTTKNNSYISLVASGTFMVHQMVPGPEEFKDMF